MKLYGFVYLMGFLLINTSLRAEEIVELALNDSKSRILAAYEVGDVDKVAIILLHGFLQTREFGTVKQLAESLSFEGYTVLRPTLSLGVDRRKGSLRCSSIHTHKMEDSSEELQLWIAWLREKGYQHIIGIGHSFGSLQMIAYQKQQADIPKFDALILTSLVYTGQGLSPDLLKQQIKAAQKAVEQKKIMPTVYQFSFCKKYTSLPDGFLSYIRWDANYTAENLNKITVPTRIIIGSEDTRINMDWIRQFKAPHISIEIIEGANHFFDAEHEFDIQEKILNGVKAFGF